MTDETTAAPPTAPATETTTQKLEDGAKTTAVAAAGYGKRFAVWAEGHPGLVGAFTLGAIVGFILGMLWPN